MERFVEPTVAGVRSVSLISVSVHATSPMRNFNSRCDREAVWGVVACSCSSTDAAMFLLLVIGEGFLGDENNPVISSSPCSSSGLGSRVTPVLLPTFPTFE